MISGQTNAAARAPGSFQFGAGRVLDTATNSISFGGFDDDAEVSARNTFYIWKRNVVISGATAALTVNSRVALSSAFTAPSLSASVNDYAVGGHAAAGYMRMSSSTSVNITGLAGDVGGRIVGFMNVGANNITLVNQSGSSLAANRFAIGANIVLGADQSVLLMYDGVSTRWRALR